MKILIACEESQAICIEARKLGHEAWSCDLKPATGGHPQWHIKDDVFYVLKHEKFDFKIAHPPCTYLCNSGVRWLFQKNRITTPAERWEELHKAVAFFNKILNHKFNIIENPIMHRYAGDMIYQKYSQIIQPWQHGHQETKATCLWLYDCKQLEPTKIVVPAGNLIHYQSGKKRSELRSKTFSGIAKAISTQYFHF